MSKSIKGYQKQLHDATIAVYKRSKNILNQGKHFDNEFEVAAEFYSKGRTRSHFGTAGVESFLSNVYRIMPLIDPDIKRIRYNISGPNNSLRS